MSLDYISTCKLDSYQEAYLLSKILNGIPDYRRVTEFLRILDTITDGVMITDGDNNIIIVNRNHALMEFLDYEDVVGHSAFDMMEKGYCTKLTPFDVADMKKSQKPFSLKMSTRTGRELIVTGIPLIDANNEIYLIVYTSRDITEFENLKHELETEVCLRSHFESELNSNRDKNIIFNSNAMKNIYETVMKISKADSAIFLMGESGVGKDVIANTIHNLSPRNNQPFIHVNCAAIPESLFESELFGYAGGAFTGALREGKPGLFELAGEGTLYLDEISETPISIQAKLLQVLQSNIFRRVGGIANLEFKARVIASTNRDIFQLMHQNKFRTDLYYRLCVIPIEIPPLRNRREDIPILANSFLNNINNKYKTNKSFSGNIIKHFLNYHWPGNVRELENLVERLYIISDSDCINIKENPFGETGRIMHHISIEGDISLKEADEKVEKIFLTQALTKHGNTRAAAESLSISQATFLRKAHRYGIEVSNKME